MTGVQTVCSSDLLARAAEALDCTLVYALVPNRPLEELVRERARKIAGERLSQIEHSMRLEDQGAPADTLEGTRNRLAEELLQGNLRRLWD